MGRAMFFLRRLRGVRQEKCAQTVLLLCRDKKTFKTQLQLVDAIAITLVRLFQRPGFFCDAYAGYHRRSAVKPLAGEHMSTQYPNRSVDAKQPFTRLFQHAAILCESPQSRSLFLTRTSLFWHHLCMTKRFRAGFDKAARTKWYRR